MRNTLSAYYSARKNYIIHREFPTDKEFACLVFYNKRKYGKSCYIQQKAQ